MEKFIINGGKKLRGVTSVSGSKNVALKAIVAACLTDEEVTIENIPLISDFFIMADIVKELGGDIKIKDHTAYIQARQLRTHKIALDKAAEVRTSSLFLAPLLVRLGKAQIPNPGGCRIGARPIDRAIEGLKKMGAEVNYDSEDGFFHVKSASSIPGKRNLKSASYKFEKNSHTGTEILIMAAVLAEGVTILENAAEEPEVDELIALLNKMGAKIKRVSERKIEIKGVEKLHGTNFVIGPDRNEIVTLAIAAIVTNGEITIRGARKNDLKEFLEKFSEAGGGWKETEEGIKFFPKGKISPVDITTMPHPGFMTDWQGPWTVLMTRAMGAPVIHETVYENRFGYVSELKKMGAYIIPFNPEVKNPETFYNFNIDDDKDEYFHAIKIFGPKDLHNAVVNISDLRAGATLVLAALSAKGESVVFGVEHLDRGYEKFEERLNNLGANIRREKE